MGALHSGHLAIDIAPPHYKKNISFKFSGNKEGATDVRDYKGVPIFAVVEVSRVTWNTRLLLFLSTRQ